MTRDMIEDATDPLGEPFQNRVFERGQQLDSLRSLVPTDATAARRFEALVREQLQALEQLLHAAGRFPADDPESPAAKFRQAMSREIEKLRDDAEWVRAKRG